jgi:hypothetical protein
MNCKDFYTFVIEKKDILGAANSKSLSSNSNYELKLINEKF